MEHAVHQPTQAQRDAMLRFEAVFAEWRAASERALEAESRLWSESLRKREGTPTGPLAMKALQLRETAQAAYLRAMALLEECD